MASLLRIGQILQGKTNTYTITKQFQEYIFLAHIHGHWRLQNVADIFRRFQSKTLFLRPLIDEIVIPSDPQSIVLRYLDDDLMTETYEKTLTRCELKFVARGVLEALKVLHDEAYIHTGI
ncbi:hypothetical protein BPAE_0639g00020 [Botrytis paeoniae]|uniref:Protein kinase domain-containing protein n=1 Tax=Botrytis paeoniae TaxID=278948 RepID=A0A4Z1EQR3_9HELO|nr:hypothetical protein BPAE_0639g00020 [Botrytis paeoniae]